MNRSILIFSNLLDDLFKANNIESKIPKEGDVNFNKTEELGEDENFKWKKETWTSLDGKSTYSKFTNESKSFAKIQKVNELKNLLNKAIDEENFEEAAKLRDEIKSL